MSNRQRRTFHFNDGTAMTRRGFLEATGAAALAAAGGAVLTQAGRAYAAEGFGDKKIRMGVVGGGFGATFAWHQHPNCVVTGVTDLIPERRDILRQHYHCDTVYDSLEDMIKQAKDIDAVAVFSGAPDHARHVKMCMENGWHVCCAVPACMALDEAALLVDVKKKTGRTYMMAESSWYRQECIFARNLYKAGGFGELFYTECEYYHNFTNMHTHPENKGTLFRNADGSRTWRWGLTPMLYPTHSNGFVVGVTDERLVKVSCLGWGTKNAPALEDNQYHNPFWNESALMQTNKGHMVRCNVFWNVEAGGERAQWFGTDATFYMPNGHLHGAFKDPGGPVEVPEYWKTSDMLPDAMRHASGHGGSAVFLSAEFINALLEQRVPECSLERSLAMTVPGIVANQSARKDGEQLTIPQFEVEGM